MDAQTKTGQGGAATGRFRDRVVGVALGGTSAERAISLKTGRALASALRSIGYRVEEYDIATDLGRLATERPAALVLGVHGGMGENGVLQGFLEALAIPYTGSGVLASALAMDKARAKSVMAAAGVPVAQGVRLGIGEVAARDALGEVLSEAGLSLPVVVKLNDSGSSVGVSICKTLDEAWSAVEGIGTSMAGVPAASSSGILVETLLTGPEYSAAFFDERFLGAIEVVPAESFYDYKAKYESATTQYRFVEDEALLARIERIGRAAYGALGCRGVARVDVMAATPEAGAALYALEVNTIPGMTETSLVPRLAERCGMSFAEFAEAMLEAAANEATGNEATGNGASED